MPSKQQTVEKFLQEFTHWASDQDDVLGVMLVGSFARHQASEGSDVDLAILCGKPEMYLADTNWAQRFGSIVRQQIEHYGKVTSLRVWYSSGLEVEYGFTGSDWAADPLDEGTRRVVDDGFQVLLERNSVLRALNRP